MEQYVVSRELAEKLKAAGYPQETLWFWEQDYHTEEMGMGHDDYDKTPESERRKVVKNGHWRVVDDYRHHIGVPEVVFNWWWSGVQKIHEAHIAAPLSDELLEQLPKFVVDGRETAWLQIDYSFINSRDFCVGYMLQDDWLELKTAKQHWGLPDTGVGHGRKYVPLVDLLAELWLRCKENGYLEDTL